MLNLNIHPSTHWFIHAFIHLFIHLFILSFIHPSIHYFTLFYLMHTVPKDVPRLPPNSEKEVYGKNWLNSLFNTCRKPPALSSADTDCVIRVELKVKAILLILPLITFILTGPSPCFVTFIHPSGSVHSFICVFIVWQRLLRSSTICLWMSCSIWL